VNVLKKKKTVRAHEKNEGQKRKGLTRGASRNRAAGKQEGRRADLGRPTTREEKKKH